MLTLFTAVFQPYQHFAPVFSVAVVIIWIAGLTLIPSIFALLGRKAFWPFIPKVNEGSKKKKGLWAKISQLVRKHPAVLGGSLFILLLAGALNVSTIQFSFNLLKSFPEDTPSRQGFELLEAHYPAGELAPVTVVLTSQQTLEVNRELLQNIEMLEENMREVKGVSSVTPNISMEMTEEELPRNVLAESKQALTFQIVLDENPYSTEALDIVEQLRADSEELLKQSGFSTNDVSLHYAGQTANQLDVRKMNERDMIVLFTLMTVVLTIVLGFQTRSILMPVLMMGSIILSYLGTLGFSWLIFKHVIGLDAISYRIPVYTFVFMVALGIDYNIMLVSRIREEARKLPWKDAVANGIALTGGVITSAGIILAATFAVLMTQPLQELFLFGFTMALGILLDTFLIRGILLPSILMLIGKNKMEK